MEAVHRYEGTVNRVMGDGIMALFGAPLAHEDHAVRACYAALGMQDAVRRYAEEAAARARRRRADPGRPQLRRGRRSRRSATTCTWTTPRWARPRTWPPAWSSSRPRAASCSPPTTLRLAEGFVAGQAARASARERPRRARSRYSSWSGAGAAAHPLPGGRGAGADAVRRAGRRAGAAPRQPLTAPAAGTARWSPWSGSRASASRGWSANSPTRTALHGWLVLESRLGLVRRRPRATCRSSTCSGATSRSRDRDDSRKIREKVTGKLLTLDAALGAAVPAAAGTARRARRTTPPGSAWTRPSAASRRSTRSSACCCARARCSRCCWSSRIFTGSTPRPRRCSTAWSRACPRRASCCSSTTARSTSTPGAARRTTRQLRHRCPPARAAPTSCSMRCSATTRASARSSSS